MANFIKEFWQNQATKYKGSHVASWGDELALELEHSHISEFIKDGDNVLDVGCANGFASLRHAQEKKICISGIDYSENMISYALENLKSANLSNVNFEVGDITDIQYEDNSFDVVYTTRVLINLPNWDLQLKGISECVRVAKSGGCIVLSEGFYEPLVRLNSFRTLLSLDPLYEHDFNRYIKQKKLEKYFADNSLSYKQIDFSSAYYIGSRVLREIWTDFEKYPGYSNPINRDFYELSLKYTGGNFGIQQIYVVNK